MCKLLEILVKLYMLYMYIVYAFYVLLCQNKCEKKSFCTFRQNSEPMTHELYSGKGKAYNDHIISSITPGTFIIA